MDTKAFAECMKRNMEKQGFSTEDLSKATGISVEILKACESGDYKPKAKELYAISEAIKVPPLILKSGGGMVHSLTLDENGERKSGWKEY